ncbi:hypothetical protein PAXRUDRAFT_749005 [Paxillus rubicundulus Ve08.2h10]|uniref:BTB domain-containing protein n=1 Tax=Paxillus rubicundulus Ve08.2h10 TaxID=930991 RepID=A0A0D0E7R8_9AGAM|nr:hypothetical protein PAXRUDRAFT_749005 [Paxillus rubicundulus Ve08.2h10]
MTRSTQWLDSDSDSEKEGSSLDVGHRGRRMRCAQSKLQDAATNHARKRMRSGDAIPTAPVGQLQKHATFWYPDGDTVVSVEDILYRLSSSRLKDQSELFSDLLSGKPSAATLQVVDISRRGDEETCYSIRRLVAKDFDVLLHMDRRPTQFHVNVPSFHEVAAILRTASLLKMDGYRAFAVSRLESWWPTDVRRVAQNPQQHAAEAFILCRQCDVPQLLRPVLYDLVRDQRARFKDTAAKEPKEESDMTVDHVVSSCGDPGLDALSREDERLVFRARELFLITWFNAGLRKPSSCPRTDADSDTGFEKCPTPRQKDTAWNASVHKSGLFKEFMHDPIMGLGALAALKWRSGDKGWCDRCVEQMQMQQKWTETTERLWNLLDELLGVDGMKSET